MRRWNSRPGSPGRHLELSRRPWRPQRMKVLNISHITGCILYLADKDGDLLDNPNHSSLVL